MLRRKFVVPPAGEERRDQAGPSRAISVQSRPGLTEGQSHHAALLPPPLRPRQGRPRQLERVVDLRRDLRPRILGADQPSLDHV